MTWTYCCTSPLEFFLLLELLCFVFLTAVEVCDIGTDGPLKPSCILILSEYWFLADDDEEDEDDDDVVGWLFPCSFSFHASLLDLSHSSMPSGVACPHLS